MLILYRLIIPFGIGTWLFVLFAVLTGLRVIKVHLKWHKRLAITAIILATIHALLVLSIQITKISANPAGNDVEITTIEEDINEISIKGFMVRWETDTSGLLHMTLQAPTKGWVSIGFDPTAGMKDANIIIGYVKDDSVFIRDDYGTSPSAHAADITADGTDDIRSKAGSETEGKTEISFSIPLNSGDVRDRVLEKGRTYTVLLAYGGDTGDDFTSYHKKRFATEISIE
jgi:hypothetical protein